MAKAPVKTSYCLCDQIQMVGDILPMLKGERGITRPKQAIAYNCTCHIKGKRGVHTGTHITLRQRGR